MNDCACSSQTAKASVRTKCADQVGIRFKLAPSIGLEPYATVLFGAMDLPEGVALSTKLVKYDGLASVVLRN